VSVFCECVFVSVFCEYECEWVNESTESVRVTVCVGVGEYVCLWLRVRFSATVTVKVYEISTSWTEFSPS
jgi:hypothetical protein